MASSHFLQECTWFYPLLELYCRLWAAACQYLQRSLVALILMLTSRRDIHHILSITSINDVRIRSLRRCMHQDIFVLGEAKYFRRVSEDIYIYILREREREREREKGRARGGRSVMYRHFYFIFTFEEICSKSVPLPCWLWQYYEKRL